MNRALLIVRPEPGAAASARRAAAMGMAVILAPLFTIVPLAWRPSDPRRYDAILFTSANAPRHAGDALTAYLHLPCYTVGEASAAAAAARGFRCVGTGAGDGDAAVRMMAERGVTTALHPCGRDATPLTPSATRIDDLPVYAAEAATALPAAARAALADAAVVALHSPRAAQIFARLADAAGLARGETDLVAISAAAAAAAGSGWHGVAVAPRPRDAAVLELAAKLCQNGAWTTGLGR